MRKLFAISAVIMVIAACNQNETSTSGDSLATFNRDSLLQRINILASDSFGGRKPFSPGETKTVAYLENAFKSIGLEPGNGNSYVQDVPMVEITPVPNAVMKVQSPGGSFDLKRNDDFVVATQNTDSVVSLNNDELIFAGYGVVAPEYNWN